MKNIKKISIIIIILVITGLIFSNYSQASEIGNIFKGADEFLTKGEPVGSKINEGQLIETSNFMYKLLLAIGILVMFIVGTIIGIKFMISSAEDKAKVKEALVPYIVGCVVIFGAFSIWSIAVNIGQEMTDGEGIAYTDVKENKLCSGCGAYRGGSLNCSNPECGWYGTVMYSYTSQYECLNCNHKFDSKGLDENDKRCPNCKLAINRVFNSY